MMQIDVRRTLAVVVGLAMVAGIAYLLLSDPDTELAPPAPPADADAAPATAAPTPSQEPVPPPELNNRGRDFDAIWRSINEYRNWIYMNDPQVQWLDDIYEKSCRCFQAEIRIIKTLNGRGWKYDDQGVDVLDIELLERPARDLATMEVTDQHAQQVLVDSEGKVVRRGAGWAPRDRVIGLHRGRDGRWKVDTVLNLDRR